MITMIYVLYSTDVCLVLDKYWGLFHFWLIFTMPSIFLIFYQSASYVVVDTSSYISSLFLIDFSRISYLFLMVIKYI